MALASRGVDKGCAGRFSPGDILFLGFFEEV